MISKSFSRKILISMMLCPIYLHAQTVDDISDDNIIVIEKSETSVIEDNSSSLQEGWSNFLTKNGWNDGNNNDGVIDIEEKGLIITSGVAYTEVAMGQPGWMESRVAAFERAELDAKQKIVRYWSESVESGRSTTMFENASWTDGIQKEVNELKTATDKIKEIGNKALDLTSEKLNQMLLELDPDFDLSEYQNETPDNLKVIYENTFNRKLQSMATRMTIGITPLYNTEGIDNNQYAVLVGVIWSPKLNKVAMSLFNDSYNIPPQSSGKTVDNYIPEEANKLISTYGTRIIIDENGEYSILAYAQAQPRPTSENRQDIALNDAKLIATERARGLIANFVSEGITVQSSETMEEISREYSDTSNSAAIIREFQTSVRASSNKVNIKGLSTVKQWHSTHPLSNQKVVGTVMLWSPSKVKSNEKMAETMTRSMQETPDTSLDNDSTNEDKGILLESLEVETSAY